MLLFQASEASGSEEEDFEYFFYDSNLRFSGAGPFCTPWPLHLIKIWYKTPLDNATY